MRQALEVLEQINQLSIGENAIALPGEIDAAMDNLRAAIEHYDQTSLELCNECGWRAIIPGEGCLTCARQKAWVGLTDEEIDKTYETQIWDARRSYARAIEEKLKEKNDG